MSNNFVIKFSNERLLTPSGLSFVGAILGKSKFVKKMNHVKVGKDSPEYQIKNGDVLLTFIGLLVQGKPCFEAVNEMKDDPQFYRYALGITRDIPSAETLRQRMDAIGGSFSDQILAANVDMFRNNHILPTAMEHDEEHVYVPLDLDVTPMDNSNSHKEGVSCTYKNYYGYAPMMAYIGMEGFLVNAELREGSQHSQKGTPEFLRETMKLAHQMTDNRLLVRMDSGNDAAENLELLMKDGSWFVIKHNRRGERSEDWLEKVKECCQNIKCPRDGKTVYIGSDWKMPTRSSADNKVRLVYEVIERTIDKYGQILLVPQIEVNTFWTNLDWKDEEVIACYHAHGECEQYHSEIKTDMDVERLPSGKFETNELVLELTILAYNILRMIGQESLRSKHRPKVKHPIRRRRLRTVISNLIMIASHITGHARKLVMALGRCNIWRHTFMDVYQRFATA